MFCCAGRESPSLNWENRMSVNTQAFVPTAPKSGKSTDAGTGERGQTSSKEAAAAFQAVMQNMKKAKLPKMRQENPGLKHLIRQTGLRAAPTARPVPARNRRQVRRRFRPAILSTPCGRLPRTHCHARRKMAKAWMVRQRDKRTRRPKPCCRVQQPMWDCH